MLLPKWADTKVRQFLERKGYVPIRGEDAPALARRSRLLQSQQIDLVIDVGANSGQYGRLLRSIGYAGRIHSFEPMDSAWQALQKNRAGDAKWSATQAALGETAGTTTLHVSENSISSSLLDLLPEHERNAPHSRYVREESVRLCRLDDTFNEIRGDATHIWLKLDVQGFEDKVLAGAETSLASVSMIQMELSLAPLYLGQKTFLPLCEYLHGRHFELVGVEAGFQERGTGVLLQLDGIFRKQIDA